MFIKHSTDIEPVTDRYRYKGRGEGDYRVSQKRGGSLTDTATTPRPGEVGVQGVPKYNAEESETQRRRVEAKFDNEIVSDTADGEAKEGRGKARPTTMSRPGGGGAERGQ